MAACRGEHDRLPAEHGHRLVVHDLATPHQAVVAVGRVGIEGHITDDAE